MARLYYLARRKPSCIYYVRFVNQTTGALTTPKSTGKTDRKEAELIAAKWLVQGTIPERTNAKNHSTQNIDSRNLVNQLKTMALTNKDVSKIVDALLMRHCIVSAVLPNTPQSEPFGHFLERFWTYDESPYVREKLDVGQSIHRRHTAVALSRVKNYWIKDLGNRPLGSITRSDVKNYMHYLIANQITIPTNKKDKNGIPVTVIKKLSPQTVNEIIRTGTTALRWAYHNGLTNNDCFSGLIYCHVPPAKRIILTLEQASAVFKSPWKNDSYRLANLTAMFTGMRIGEVQALQLQDIGMDRIYVRHNWAGADGLKVPKNGDTREIPIPVELRDMLLAQANKNPYGRGLGGFVFFGLLPDAPIDNRVWLAALHEVMESLGIPNQRKISFHCWRHLYTARMADVVAERKLQQATGHKTLAMVEHYAAHESEQTFRELGAAANSIFLPVIQQMDE